MHTLAQLRDGALNGITSLKLCEGLTDFPEEILDLADTLEVLDLSGNRLSELPADFGRLHKLRILFCSNNLFTVLPAVLGRCPLLEMVGFKANQIATIPPASLNTHLRWLILTDNCIAELPPQIGKCARMQKLMLAGNRLTHLPVQLSHCTNLELLRISANQLTELPAWLPAMPRLRWLAFGGNCAGATVSVPSLPYIDWASLTVQQAVGEGASGIIYKAVMSEGGPVAVKVFKGAVTSDGLPEDEMNAFMAAGHHAGLTRVVGRIAGHPEGKQGVVMDWIPERYYNLGLPPDFDTCTRDRFVAGAQLTTGQAVRIAATIASVGAHLRSRGIMHGDLYAHNTLVDERGAALLGDFGAAWQYNTKEAAMAALLERVEVSAFGCLLDDLIQLCKGDDRNNPTLLQLQQLRDASLVPDVLSRPDFAHMSLDLERLLLAIGRMEP